MKITFVRHGNTNSYKKGLCQKFSEPLSESGKNQAKKVAYVLKDESYDIVYVSTMKRAIQTADQILIYHPKVKVAYEDLICEYNNGEWEGKSKEWRANKRKGIARKLDIPTWEVRPPHGESQEDLKLRVKKFSQRLKKIKCKSILVISHSTAIFFILFHLLGLKLDDWDKYHLNLGCYLTIEKHNNEFKLIKGPVLDS